MDPNILTQLIHSYFQSQFGESGYSPNAGHGGGGYSPSQPVYGGQGGRPGPGIPPRSPNAGYGGPNAGSQPVYGGRGMGVPTWNPQRQMQDALWGSRQPQQAPQQPETQIQGLMGQAPQQPNPQSQAVQASALEAPGRPLRPISRRGY